MSKRFSEWLANHEPVVRLLYRLAIVATLAVGVNSLSYVEQDLAAISDGITALQDEIASIRADLEGQQDDPAVTGTGATQRRRL
jgi:hypothetical protein